MSSWFNLVEFKIAELGTRFGTRNRSRSGRHRRRYCLSAMRKPDKATNESIDRRIEDRRRDSAFQARLEKLIKRNRRLLDRLSR